VTPISTSTRAPCGPPFGWVRYTVQQGDNLYHIATMFGITTSQLQGANCLGSSITIHPGQLLWVPNRPPQTPVTPGIIISPTYTFPTETATEIPPTPTDTLEPTSTSTPVTPGS
jgi:LysM repeat protein